MQRPLGNMSRAIRANPLQMQKLLDILSEDGVLTDGKVVYTTVTRHEFWKKIAIQLNAMEGGVYKNPYKWCKVWADWKNKTKNKANKLLRHSYSLDEPKPSLTSLEYRLLKLIGVPAERIADIEPVGKFELDHLEFLDPSNNSIDGVKPMEYVAEDGSSLNLEYPDEGESDGSESLNFKIGKRKKKVLGKKYKRRKAESPTINNEEIPDAEQCRVRTIDRLEQHRIRQKDEELRLRALELKLKGDELKLKEAEMAKVNTLVNIEEEKLKCFRDVVGLLRELIDRTKNGNPGRYNNII